MIEVQFLSEGDETLSTLEVARALGLAVRSVQLMVDRGELKAWRTPGGHRRISRASVMEWQKGHGRIPELVSTLTPEGEHVAAPAAVPKSPAHGTSTGRVLLIEDSAHFQNLVSLVVKHTLPGVELHVASDGISGLAMYGSLQPDVLLVDLLLPGIDGATLIAGLRTSPQFSGSDLIVVTSLGEEERSPYQFALDGIPIVHKSRLAHELPVLLAEAFSKRGRTPAN